MNGAYVNLIPRFRPVSGINIKTPGYIRFAVMTAGLIAIVVGLAVLAGWKYDIIFLKSLHPDYLSMKMNTAICFVLIGISVFLSAVFPKFTSISVIAKGASFIVIIIALATAFEYLFNWDAGIDELFINDADYTKGGDFPGRMTGYTSISFLSLGLAIIFSNSKLSLFQFISQTIALAIGLISFIWSYQQAF